MTDLSPSTQAVLDAFSTYPVQADQIGGDLVPALAAALRAIADEVASETSPVQPDDPGVIRGVWGERRRIRRDLLDIAAELESLPE